MDGILFNGKHSYYDIGLTMTGNRDIGFPIKNKIKRNVAFSNVVHDFSSVYGDQTYSERSLEYTFNVIDFHRLNRKRVEQIKSNAINWLMGTSRKSRLDDPWISDYYFMAEVEGDVDFKDLETHGELTVTFTAYPFKIAKLREGNNLWATFNFDTDVLQKTATKVDAPTAFNELSIGSFATIGSWATQYFGSGKIPFSNLGVSRKILSKKYGEQSISKVSYELEGITGFVIEQDIVQAHTNPTKMTLINPGTSSVVPTVTSGTKISIIKDNIIYNFFDGKSQNELFRLSPGENNIKIYNRYDGDINFEYYKELI